jgi:hypothetical protein
VLVVTGVAGRELTIDSWVSRAPVS